MATDFRDTQSSQAAPATELPFSDSSIVNRVTVKEKNKSKKTKTGAKTTTGVCSCEIADQSIDPRLKPFLNKIITGDCIQTLKTFSAESIDLIATSPPYNLKNSSGNGMKAGTKTGRWANNALQNGYATHDDCMPHDEYVRWQRKCLTQMMRVLKNTGAIFYNHKWRVQNGLLQDRADIIKDFLLFRTIPSVL